MSLWQFAAVVAGWNAAHGAPERPEAPSAEELEAAIAMADAMEQRHAERSAAF